MEFTGLTSASHMSLPEAGYGSEEGYVGSEISGAVSGVTTPGASRLQASQSQQRSTTMQRLQGIKGSTPYPDWVFGSIGQNVLSPLLVGPILRLKCMDAQCISNTTRVCLKAMEKHFFLLLLPEF